MALEDGLGEKIFLEAISYMLTRLKKALTKFWWVIQGRVSKKGSQTNKTFYSFILRASLEVDLSDLCVPPTLRASSYRQKT